MEVSNSPNSGFSKLKWISGVSFGTIIGLTLAFFALVPEAKRCDFSRQLGNEILCPYPTPSLTPTSAPTITPRPSATSRPTSTPIPTITPLPDSALLLEENFGDNQAEGWDRQYGIFRIDEIDGGNRVWHIINDGFSIYSLPEHIHNYAFEAKVMQASGNKGALGLEVRLIPDANCGFKEYLGYMTISDGWMNLTTYTDDCTEWRAENVFANYHTTLSNNIWYTLRVETQGSEVRGYLDGILTMKVQNSDFKSNVIGVWICCGENSHFYFDNLRAWAIDD